MGAAGAALVIGVAGGVAAGVAAGRAGGGSGDDGEQGGPAAAVVAVAQLAPLATAQQGVAGEGVAEVVHAVGSTAGQDRLVVDTGGLARVEGAVHEVWLLDPTTGGLFAVGFLIDGKSPAGGYQLPEGIDFERYSAVDVSSEPLDGDELHSGASELRGQLEPVGT